jgi:enediyne biosynthesis thioesterase
MRAYEYRHVIGFEETNLVGNVYYVNHLRWQGRCRELFLHDHAPVVVEALIRHELVLVTTRCACDYFAELAPLDEIAVRMRLGDMAQHRITLLFEYVRTGEVIARGEQQIACMRRQEDRLVPIPVPAELQGALAPYR